jgi:hypothetical protein
MSCCNCCGNSSFPSTEPFPRTPFGFSAIVFWQASGVRGRHGDAKSENQYSFAILCLDTWCRDTFAA